VSCVKKRHLRYSLARIEGNRSTPAREPNEASEPVFDVGGVEKQTGAWRAPVSFCRVG